MLKGIGILLIIFSTSIVGYYFSARYRYRREDLDCMKRGLLILKNQICFYSMPLPECMMEISNRLDGIVANIFEMASLLMQQQDNMGIEEIWEEAVIKNLGCTYFSSEDRNALLSFGKTLGYLDLEQQRASIDYLISYIEESEALISEKSSKNSRLYCSMGVISGLLLVVILL